MNLEQIVSKPDVVSVLVIVFVPLAAATLVPAVHKFLPWPAEVLIWSGMIAASILRVTGIADPKVREATFAAAWAGGRLLNVQLASLAEGVRAWLVVNRFTIATIVVIVAGVDALVLALIRSHRSAVRAMPQVRLGEWFVLPLRTAEPAPDALGDLDRRLATRTRVGVALMAHSTAARALVVKPFAHAATHLLGPGPARLRMVKLALGFEGHEEASGSTQGAPVAPPDTGRRASPAMFFSRGTDAGRRRHRRMRWTPLLPHGKAPRSADLGQPGSSDRAAAVPGSKVKDGAAPQRTDLLAS